MRFPRRSQSTLALLGLSVMGLALWLVFQEREPGKSSPELAQSKLASIPQLGPDMLQGSASIVATEEPKLSEATHLVERERQVPMAALRLPSIQGRVLHGQDQGVASIRVRLLGGPQERASITDVLGHYSFDGLKHGTYRLHVDPGSLPKGFLPPRQQHIARPYAGVATGMHAPLIRVALDIRYAVDIRIFEMGSVRGQVLRAGGLGLMDATFVLQGEGTHSQSESTDADGHFLMGRIYPGTYTVSISYEASPGTEAGLAPLPIRLHVAPGSDQQLAKLVLGADGHTLIGRVVDENDAPVPQLLIRCQADTGVANPLTIQALTNENGEFRLGRISSSTFLFAAVENDSRANTGNRRLAGPSPAQSISTVGAPTLIQLGTIQIKTLHPFTVLGSIRLSRDWLLANDLEAWHLQIIAGPTSAPEKEHRVIQRTRFNSPRVKPSAQGGRFSSVPFQWSAPTSAAGSTITAVLFNDEGKSFERNTNIEPIADGRLEVHLSFE
jgi:hypothetical protein